MIEDEVRLPPRGGFPKWMIPVVVLILLANALLLLGTVLWLTESPSAQDAFGPVSELKVAEPAPDFEVQMLGGETVALADLKGRPVWLSFWATWCAPCRAEMPEVLAANVEAQKLGIRFIAVDVAEPETEVSNYLKRSGYTALPAALDPDGAVSSEYSVYNLPTHVFIDSAGKLHHIKSGELTRSEFLEIARELK